MWTHVRQLHLRLQYLEVPIRKTSGGTSTVGFEHTLNSRKRWFGYRLRLKHCMFYLRLSTWEDLPYRNDKRLNMYRVVATYFPKAAHWAMSMSGAIQCLLRTKGSICPRYEEKLTKFPLRDHIHFFIVRERARISEHAQGTLQLRTFCLYMVC